jgi:hypothetical protein
MNTLPADYITVSFDEDMSYSIPMNIISNYPLSVIWGFYEATGEKNIKMSDVSYEDFGFVYDVLVGFTSQCDMEPHIRTLADRLGLLNDTLDQIQKNMENKMKSILYEFNSFTRTKNSYIFCNEKQYRKYNKILCNVARIVPVQLIFTSPNIATPPNYMYGATGEVGPTGPTGCLGAVGDRGEQGCRGEQGNPGMPSWMNSMIEADRVPPPFTPLDYTKCLKFPIEKSSQMIKCINVYGGLPIYAEQSGDNVDSMGKCFDVSNIKNNIVCTFEARYSMFCDEFIGTGIYNTNHIAYNQKLGELWKDNLYYDYNRSSKVLLSKPNTYNNITLPVDNQVIINKTIKFIRSNTSNIIEYCLDNKVANKIGTYKQGTRNENVYECYGFIHI